MSTFPVHIRLNFRIAASCASDPSRADTCGFRSQDYAVDFGILNKDADWVKINGKSISSLLS